ncbi:hypothetical protein Tco_1232168, partial [Tanacetum coccineum]
TTGLIADSIIEHSVTTVAADRIHHVQDTGGYLPEIRPFDGSVKIEEVYDDARVEESLARGGTL